MFLEDFEKYKSYYEKGAKRISVRSYHPKLSKENTVIEKVNSYGNFDLFFCKNGFLTGCLQKDSNASSKVIFTYVWGKLFSITAMRPDTNILDSITELCYDTKQRVISETCRSIDWVERGFISEVRKHSYNDNTERLDLPSTIDNEDTTSFFSTFDPAKRLIESKAYCNDNEFLYWNKMEYNQDSALIRFSLLDEDGIVISVEDYLPLINGYESGYKSTSDGENYTRMYNYTFNEKKHWTSKIATNDDKPIFINEREIIYY